jgi:hypothetical protein
MRVSKDFASSLTAKEKTTLLSILKKIEPGLKITIDTAIEKNKTKELI